MDRKIGEEIPLAPLVKQGKINKGRKNIRNNNNNNNNNNEESKEH